MTALVDELIQNARNSAISITDLMRDALIVAKLLDVTEFSAWIHCELNGYKEGDEKLIPEYRQVQADLKVINSLNVPIPFYHWNTKKVRALTSVALPHPLSEMEVLIQNKTEKSFMMSFPPEIEQILMNEIQDEFGVPMRPVRQYSKTVINSILDAVRTRVLDWAIELKRKGINGVGMSFSTEEKQRAQPMSINISGDNNIINTHGSNSLAQINSPNSTQTQQFPNQVMETLNTLIETLQDLLIQKEIPHESCKDLETALVFFQTQVTAPQPNLSLLKLTAQGLKSIAESTMGSILASKLLPVLNAFLVSL